ncbi:HAD family phosphatase [Candidatus Woesearchaeota archaeon]|nr:HAD family phosphatase [Candidatus Woesearchaeota archaeon]
MIKAVIFDMDGVIIDTKKLHFKAMKEVFKQEFGISVTKKDYEGLFGLLDVDAIKKLLKQYELKGDMQKLRDKKRRILQKAEKGHLRLFPGAKELIRKLSKRYRLALTSSEWKGIIKKALDEFNLRKYFSVIVGKEDIRRHKPDPDPYLCTAKRLRVKPGECVVIEDSVAGVESAKKAGMKVIAVMTSYPKEKLKKADLVFESVKGIRI